MAMQDYDVAIIGGGASGMVAAIELKMSSPELAVVILEKNGSLGRKLRATGGGRCNITNTAAVGFMDIMGFFRKIGIVTRIYENGLVYPYSESAADVVELLSARIGELGINVLTDTAVTSCDKNDSFTVNYDKKDADGTPVSGTLTCDKLVLALGGKAGPNYGTTGDGYSLARSFGHSIVTPIPVLTSIECAEWGADVSPRAVSLAGTRARGTVRLYKDENGNYTEDTLIFEESGEIQFTPYGLSGICVFNMTRYMRYNRTEGESLRQFLVRIDLFSDGNINKYLADRKKEGLPNDHVLRTVLKPMLADYVQARGVESIHALEFHPTAVRGWKEAQATAGGIPMIEINPKTCESDIVSDLYITGELLDYDGPCGGFNLSNAWLTALRAAHAISE